MRRIVISSHVLMPGASHALLDYLISKKNSTIRFISLPLVTQRYLSARDYPSKRIISKKKAIEPSLFEYLYEFVFVISNSLNFSSNIDVFFGVDPLNAVAGIILRRIGRVRKVIFYGIDFVPKRFTNPLINVFFHYFEKIAVKYSDEVWNVSPRISEGRKKYLGIDSKKYVQKTVPIGIGKIIRKKSYKVHHTLIFIGHLLEKQGLQLVIDSFPNILKKLPDIKLTIIGGGEYENELKKQVKRLNLENSVNFLGWIDSREKISVEMQKSDMGIACYKPEKNKLSNFTYYADPTKIKDYLSYGLPVLTTNVPYNAYEINSAGCGFIVEYRKEEIEKAIIDFYKSESLIIEKKRRAYQYIEKYTWNKIFDKATNEII